MTAAVAAGVTPSASCAVWRDGAGGAAVVVGDAVRFGPNGRELEPAERTPAHSGTRYDLASVTKVVTAVTALTLVRDGLLALDVSVAEWLPAYRSDDKRAVTLRHLLSHTAGLPPTWGGWKRPPPGGRPGLVADLLGTRLVSAPGTAFGYSCVGYNTVMALAEAVTGQSWADLVVGRVLGAGSGLGFHPDVGDCAATEYQPELGRGMVRGIVHDESAWSLGGVAGNAGLFGTAEALLAFGERMRAGLPGVLAAELEQELWTDQLPRLLPPGVTGAGYGQGLGLRIGQQPWMGRPEARGHNGFTGTSLLMDRERGLSIVLLTNRVHPSRSHSDVVGLRAAVSNAVYDAG
nr:serine hydrolase domain-containing protein [Cryobacterium roopkundense]